MMKRFWPLLLAGMSCSALAQQAGFDGDTADGPPRGWQLGAAALVTQSPYAGEGTRVVPIPLVTYEGERFYFRGITAGWTILELGSFELSALAKLRLDGFKVDDLGREELADNGLDYRRLEDRDMGIDAGLGMKWRGSAGELEIELLADASDKSGGQELSIQYGYPVELGQSLLTPSIGVSWLSKDMANYYYGTLDEEVARGVTDYKPGAAAIAHIGVSFIRPIGERWAMLGHLRYSSLPDEFKKSPLVERDADGMASMFIGFSRAF